MIYLLFGLRFDLASFLEIITLQSGIEGGGNKRGGGVGNKSKKQISWGVAISLGENAPRNIENYWLYSVSLSIRSLPCHSQELVKSRIHPQCSIAPIA